MEGGFKETLGWGGGMKELEKCGGGLGWMNEFAAGPLLMEGKEEPCFLSTSCKPSCLWLDAWKVGFQLLPHLPPSSSCSSRSQSYTPFNLLELVDDLPLLLKLAPGL